MVDDHGLDLTGWQLWSANSVSDDGLAIAGYGTNPSGNIEAWIAVLEPTGTIIVEKQTSPDGVAGTSGSRVTP